MSGWKEVLWNRRLLICIFNGFISGLPLYYVYQLVPAWLRDEGVDLKTIGLFALVGLPYNWKFLWAPLMDSTYLPFLGRRRTWMLAMQVACMLAMFSFGFFPPEESIQTIALLAGLLALFSATQDIALDAYRRELLPDNELGLGNSMYMNGYRAASFIPGGLGLILADQMSWPQVHLTIGLFMLVGVITTLVIKELPYDKPKNPGLVKAVIEPLSEFFRRDGFHQALLVLGFLFLYKIGDNMATALSTPFYLDVGFSKTVIGSMVKMVNFWSMIVGSFLGGLYIYKKGINKSLWLFGLVQMLSIFGFAVLNETGPVLWVLGVVIGFEYLGVGLGSAALIAFMSRSTSKQFTATQFALFSSLIALPRTFANSITGYLIEGIAPTDEWLFGLFGAWEGLGYTNFFLFCGLCALPGMTLLYWVAPWSAEDPSSAS